MKFYNDHFFFIRSNLARDELMACLPLWSITQPQTNGAATTDDSHRGYPLRYGEIWDITQLGKSRPDPG